MFRRTSARTIPDNLIQNTQEGCGCPKFPSFPANFDAAGKFFTDFPAARSAIPAKVWAFSGKDKGCWKIGRAFGNAAGFSPLRPPQPSWESSSKLCPEHYHGISLPCFLRPWKTSLKRFLGYWGGRRKHDHENFPWRCSWRSSGELSGPSLLETRIFMCGALRLFRIVCANVRLNFRHSKSFLVPGNRLAALPAPFFSAKVKWGREKGEGKNYVINCRKTVVNCRDALWRCYEALMSHEQSIGNVVEVPEIVGKLSEIVVTFSVPSPSRCPLLTFTDFQKLKPEPELSLSVKLKLAKKQNMWNWTCENWPSTISGKFPVSTGKFPVSTLVGVFAGTL